MWVLEENIFKFLPWLALYSEIWGVFFSYIFSQTSCLLDGYIEVHLCKVNCSVNIWRWCSLPSQMGWEREESFLSLPISTKRRSRFTLHCLHCHIFSFFLPSFSISHSCDYYGSPRGHHACVCLRRALKSVFKDRNMSVWNIPIYWTFCFIES